MYQYLLDNDQDSIAEIAPHLNEEILSSVYFRYATMCANTKDFNAAKKYAQLSVDLISKSTQILLKAYRHSQISNLYHHLKMPEELSLYHHLLAIKGLKEATGSIKTRQAFQLMIQIYLFEKNTSLK